MLDHAAIFRFGDGLDCRVRLLEGDDFARVWRTRLISAIVIARADKTYVSILNPPSLDYRIDLLKVINVIILTEQK